MNGVLENESTTSEKEDAISKKRKVDQTVPDDDQENKVVEFRK
mgnify:CR=1 FL=1